MANKKIDNNSLHSEAVDRLVNADKKAYDKQSKNTDPGKKYRSSFFDKIPAPVKALFIKFWFYGAVCFFIYWGLNVIDSLDIFVIMSIILGLVNDILVNNILRFIEIIPNENAKWMMFPKKKYWTLPANILYTFLVFYCVRAFYVIINLLGQSINLYVGVEPIFFGIIYTSFDLLFIGMKNLMKTIIQDAKDKVNKQ